MAAVNAAHLERLTQSIQSIAQAVTLPLEVVTRVFKSTYQLAMRSPYDKYFADRGYQKCHSIYPMLCYTKNEPGVAEQNKGPVPGGKGDRVTLAQPEVNDTAIVNLAKSAVIFTKCTDNNCTLGQVWSPLGVLKLEESKAAEVEEPHIPAAMRKEYY